MTPPARYTKAEQIIRAAAAALIRETLAEVMALLESGLNEIKIALAAAPGEYAAWYLPQLQAEIERVLTTLGGQAARVLDDSATTVWSMGIDALDIPLKAGGVTVAAVMPHLDESQLLAMRAFMTDRIQDVSKQAVGRINAELGMSLIGARPLHETLSAVQEIMGGASRKRATTIVRTELSRTYSVASDERARQHVQAGVEMDKVWRRSGKLRPRLSHAIADGQRVAVDKPFVIGEVKMMHPHDPTAPASETINCGCVALYRPRGWKQTTPDHRPFTAQELDRYPKLADIEEARQTGESIHKK